ncbi:AMP-binding protein [Streptomyces exfoliatus]|uniref:AMP-binding protein n=1 Tax=Streptomyces exfoliatus TaxID=1905 RepID=UPI003C304D12
MSDLVTFLRDTAARHPERPALRQDGDSRTYTDLDRQSARIASLLRTRGIRKGDRVAVMVPNVPDFVAVYYGILRAGAVVVPMNPLMKEREVAYYLEDSGAALVFAWHDGPALTAARVADGRRVVAVEPTAFAGLLAEHAPLDSVVPVAAEDTAVILYTPGTTGTPRGAALTHGGLAHNTAANATGVQRLTADDVVLGCLPLFHTFGQTCAMNSAVYSGASLVLLPRFEAATALELIASEPVSVFAGAPTMYGALLHDSAAQDADLSSLRLCVSGGAPMPVELLHEFELTFGCTILEGYGMSETGPVVTFNRPDRPRKAGSIGTPIRDVEVRLVDDGGGDAPLGEIGDMAVRGPNLMKGLRASVKDRVAPSKYPRRIWLVDALPMGPSGKILKRAITGPTS